MDSLLVRELLLFLVIGLVSSLIPMVMATSKKTQERHLEEMVQIERNMATQGAYNSALLKQSQDTDRALQHARRQAEEALAQFTRAEEQRFVTPVVAHRPTIKTYFKGMAHDPCGNCGLPYGNHYSGGSCPDADPYFTYPSRNPLRHWTGTGTTAPRSAQSIVAAASMPPATPPVSEGNAITGAPAPAPITGPWQGRVRAWLRQEIGR